MAYSSGFSPHPRISYANAAPTGAASEAEYLEIGLAAACDPDKVRDAVDQALPPGLDIVEIVEAPAGALADELNASRWRIDVPGLSAVVLESAVEAFLVKDAVPVRRMTKNGIREFDARAAVITLDAEDGLLVMTLAHRIPLVRPDDVLTALAQTSHACTPSDPPILTRLAQGRLNPETGIITAPGH